MRGHLVAWYNRVAIIIKNDDTVCSFLLFLIILVPRTFIFELFPFQLMKFTIESLLAIVATLVPVVIVAPTIPLLFIVELITALVV